MSNLLANNKGQAHRGAFVPQGIECIIDMLIGRLKAIYPAWGTSIKTQQDYLTVKLVWTEGLKVNGITTGEQVRQGLEVAMKQNTPFLPSVGMFANWCKEVDVIKLGMPSLEKYQSDLKSFMSYSGMTFDEKYQDFKSKNGDFTTDIQYYLMFDGFFSIKKSNNSDLKDNVKAVYTKWVDKLKNGEQVPPKRILIDKPEPRQAPPEVIESGVSILRKAMRGVA